MEKYLEEQEHLDYTYQCMSQEVEHCNDELERLRKEGISLTYEDAKRGTHLNVMAQLSFYANRIQTLSKIFKSPYFGRFDFAASNAQSKKIYIGKTSLNNGEEFIITDWRAPICNLYYDSNVGYSEYESPEGKISGNMTLKRQINIIDEKLIDIIDSDLVSNDELLKPYLSHHADNKMKTIIESIQKEQNQIIRRPISDNIIVQGVAGSGKTSVALHRIAYLIYSLGTNIDSKQFLVLGPNDYFLNYISSILPELETEPVEQKTYFALACDYLKEPLIFEDYSDITLKKQELSIFQKMQAYKSSLQFKENLNLFLQDYLENYLISTDFEIDGVTIFSKEEIKAMLFSRSDKTLDFNSTCNYFVNKFEINMDKLYETLNQKYRDIYTKLPKNDPARKEAIERSNQLYKLIKEKGVKSLKDYFKKLNIKPLNLYKLFIASLNTNNTDLTTQEIAWIRKRTLISLRKKKVSFEDLPALMYINFIMSKQQIKYRHIVIDEAQDYGLFHFDVLKELTASNTTYSIYGDLAQAIYSYRSISSWEELNQKIFNSQFELLHLNKSYRTTIEITENANKILNYMNLNSATPVIRHGLNVLYQDVSDNPKYKLDVTEKWLEKGYKTIAIICKTEEEAKEAHEYLMQNGINNKYISSKDNQYEGGIFVLTSSSAKGLEFDAIIINDASSNVYRSDSAIDTHLLYVACTRALHEQAILYNQNLTESLNYTKTNSKTLNRKL